MKYKEILENFGDENILKERNKKQAHKFVDKVFLSFYTQRKEKPNLLEQIWCEILKKRGHDAGI